MGSKTKIDDSKLLHDVNLTDNGLSEEAKYRFPFYTEILDSLNCCGRSIPANDLISPAGKHIICSELIRSHNNVKNVCNYLAAKPSTTRQKITTVPMIVVCGLPRTGSTLLHNMMACDPFCRAPLLTDMIMQPTPPISRSHEEEHTRRSKTEADVEAKIFDSDQCDFKALRKNFTASHPLFPTDDDALLQAEVGVRIMYAALAGKETNFFSWFIDQENKDFSYQYHQTILQMLHDVDPPHTHWQLKGSLQTCFIDTLLKYYPQSSLIMSHRRLDQVIPSTDRLFLS